MRVLVTGATGYIGSAVAAKLKAAGHMVVGLARNERNVQAFESLGYEAMPGDLSQPGTMGRAVNDVDAVISTGTTNDGQQDISAIEVMLEELRGTNKPFIYTSGCWILGDTGGNEADDDTPVNPIPLTGWRPGVEQRVIEGDGVRGIVIRPGIVYGYGGGIPAMLTGGAQGTGVVRYIGDGSTYWPLVHVDDLVDLYVLALEKAPAGTIMNGVSESVQVREIAAAGARGQGLEGKIEATPLEQAQQQMGPFADALVTSQRISSPKALQLGWQPHAPGIIEELEGGSYAKK